MKIQYSWTNGADVTEDASSLEINSEHIPRIGELVEINFQLGKDEWCVKSGRVKDVIWMVKHHGTMVSVILDTSLATVV